MPNVRRMAVVALAAAVLLLAGCMLLPGKFGSEMTVRADGTFAFAYKGDIHLVALSKLAAEAKHDEAMGEFTPSACFDEDTIEERPCTKEELAQQRADWEQAKAAGNGKAKDDAEMMKALLGGIDPADPRAAEEFAARLRRQVGWRSVIDKGDGRFEVDFAITGRLDHDFSFPTVERMPIVSPFVTAIRRADGTVRVEAPAFAAGAGGAPMMGVMGAMAKSDPRAEGLPDLDGTFTLVTDGEILANNTDEGPQPGTTGKRLSWRVDARTTAAPSALIKLGR
ncbi:MAG TPA: hypothetical protein VM055_06875 [Novosphingobium sp.]|nr:hypothetical protein [Novosphingobium sp.]